MKKCQICEFVAPNLKFLLKHIRQVHADRPGFHITCLLSGCQRTFRKFEVYRNHVYGHHTESEALTTLATEAAEHSFTDNLSETMSGGDESQTESLVDEDAAFCAKRRAATWILKIQETYKLTQSTVDSILGDVTGLFQDLLSNLFEEVKSILTKSDVDLTTIPDVSRLFDSTSFYMHPFQGLETKHLQLKFYKEHFNLLVRVIVLRSKS